MLRNALIEDFRFIREAIRNWWAKVTSHMSRAKVLNIAYFELCVGKFVLPLISIRTYYNPTPNYKHIGVTSMTLNFRQSQFFGTSPVGEGFWEPLRRPLRVAQLMHDQLPAKADTKSGVSLGKDNPTFLMATAGAAQKEGLSAHGAVPHEATSTKLRTPPRRCHQR